MLGPPCGPRAAVGFHPAEPGGAAVGHTAVAAVPIDLGALTSVEVVALWVPVMKLSALSEDG